MARIEVIRAPDAPLGGGDPTRRHAVRDGARVLMPGLTAPEAEAAAGWLAGIPEPDRALVLSEVTLPVLLTDGAGPHLLDADGSLVLVLGRHPRIEGVHVAMGAPAPRHAVGAVRRRAGGGWIWLARAEVPEAGRVAALDGVDAAPDRAALAAWAGEWAGAIPTLEA
ncbi:MAG: hypothetical protein ACO3PB_03090 [Miltoncostaeaceae bacterium]